MNQTKMVVALLGLALVAGCIGKRPANPATTRPVTMVDPKLATVEYWLAQPATGTVALDDFTRLWETCEEVGRDYLLPIERRDYRAGVLVAGPVISKQLFEFWRKDAGTFDDALESSMATIRRSIYFEFKQRPEGGYAVTPKVIVEKRARLAATEARPTPETPTSYWFALRRDEVMERKVTEAVQRKLVQQGTVAKEK